MYATAGSYHGLSVRPGGSSSAGPGSMMVWMTFSLEQFQAARAEAESLDWLAQAIGRAAFVRLSGEQLIARAGDLKDAERQMVLRELQRRLEREGDDALRTKLRRLLEELDTCFRTPGSAAQATDRMLDRFLHRLPRDEGADLALACGRSVRRGRRRAAWHFYREHGHDDASRRVAATAFPEDGRMDFLRSVCVDGPLIALIGAERVLEQLPEFYWRGRTLAAVLEDDPRRFATIAPNVPAEALFAIYLLGAADQKQLAFELLEAHPDDAGVCSTAIRVFGILGANAELDLAISCGERLLQTTTNWLHRERMALGR